MEKNKKMIKMDILNKFREMEDEVARTIPEEWLKNDYFNRLNPIEKKLFNKAVTELASRGLVKYTPGLPPIVKLTRKGEILIHY